MKFEQKILETIADNTITFGAYKMYPTIQLHYPPIATTGSNSVFLNGQVQQQPENRVMYQMSGPSFNMLFTPEQLEVISKFIQMLDYKKDFDSCLK